MTSTRKPQQQQQQRMQMQMQQEPTEYANTTGRLRDNARKPVDSASRDRRGTHDDVRDRDIKQQQHRGEFTAPPRPPRYTLQQQQQQDPQRQSQQRLQEPTRRHDFIHRDQVPATTMMTFDRRDSTDADADDDDEHDYPRHPLSHMRDIVLPTLEPSLAHNTHSYTRRERLDDDGCSSTSSGSTSTVGFDDDDHYHHHHHHHPHDRREFPRSTDLYDPFHRSRDLKDFAHRHQHHHQHHHHQHQHHQHRHHHPSPSSLAWPSSLSSSSSSFAHRDVACAPNTTTVPATTTTTTTTTAMVNSADPVSSSVCLSCSGCDRCRPRLVRHQDLGHAFEIELYVPETFGNAIKVEAEPRQVEITADREVKLAGERRTFNFTERIKFGSDVDEHAVAAVMNPSTRCLTVTCPKRV